ncbi:nucleotide pyrophosphohydrolase [Lysobacter niastensis]|uniref:Nucleotide pyrophosphohydrolase n=1 Tax=Lysobacter niastensis TaxID=380629 RepID=A0ABS0BCP7_9GAMM|nr:nucleotide pyrophosphohydrolase [Lysobacter niastensis]MBF6024900.1 nucleotide pyrophosphohydrolase [Lysobacter niastensis]
MDIEKIQRALQAFADERNWEQFHNPKNLAMALAGEAGELLEIVPVAPEEAASVSSNADLQSKVAEELADISLYLLRLADKAGVDLDAAIRLKMEGNARKYPADRVYGSRPSRARLPQSELPRAVALCHPEIYSPGDSRGTRTTSQTSPRWSPGTFASSTCINLMAPLWLGS